MKLIMENWRKFVKENLEDSEEERIRKDMEYEREKGEASFYDEDPDQGEDEEESSGRLESAKELVAANKFLNSFAEGLDEDNLVDLDSEFVFLHVETTFNHAKHSHSRESDLPGSKFSDRYSIDDSLLKLVRDTVTKQDGERVDAGYGIVHKWFNVEMGVPIGFDSLVKAEDIRGKQPRDFIFKEPIRNNAAIPSLIDQGLEVHPIGSDSDDSSDALSDPEMVIPGEKYEVRQPLKVIDAPLQPTKIMNLILVELGKLDDGKTLTSLITMFPGVNEPEARNKKDYIEKGYYFVTGKS
jgi:hypothetical protein